MQTTATLSHLRTVNNKSTRHLELQKQSKVQDLQTVF